MQYLRWTAIFFLWGSSHLALSQFSGVVVNQITQQPISDVHLVVIGTSIGTSTDLSGQYNLEMSRTDSIRVRISAIGFATAERTLSKGSNSRIELAASSILLNNEVTITAQRSERLSFDVALATTTISSLQLKEYGARSTPEALMNQTGVWVQKTNHGGGSPIVRGLIGNQILLLVDGIRLNNATYRYGPNQYLSTIDPQLIERIEVNRGSGSVLYGSDALGGVVQLLSRTPSFSTDGLKVRGEVSTKWMSAGMEKSLRPELEFQGKNVAFLGGVSFRSFGDVLAGGTLGFLRPSGYEERSADAKLLVRNKLGDVFTAAFQQTTQQQVPRYDQVVQGGFKTYEFEPQIRQLAYIRWEHAMRNPWVQALRITTSLNRSIEGTVSQKNNSDDLKKQNDEVNTVGLIAEIHSNPIAQWHAQSGVEYYRDHVSSNAVVFNTSNNTETQQRGSYADGSVSSNWAVFTNHQLEWKRFQFLAGARWNAVEVKVMDKIFGDQQINPQALIGNAGVMFSVNPRLRVMGNMNTGFRAPNVDDMSKFGTLEANVFEIPSGGLSPERSTSVEVGFKYKAPRLSWTITTYQTKLSDLIDRVPSTYLGSNIFDSRTVYQKKNVGEALVQGFEADVEMQVLSSLTLNGNITYTHGQNETKNEPMRRIPPMFGKLGIRYSHSSGFWMRAEWAMAASQSRLAAGDKSDVRIAIRLVNGEMPAWDIFGVYAGYSYKFVGVQISAQNIFDKAYRVYASGVDGYGRCFTASIRVRF
ncbi:MAG: TonB-dependent receptor [Cyclobacteriaceae bacterium]|nr:TonB-dependent receptor [Cyclobacteriaceae bacterium]